MVSHRTHSTTDGRAWVLHTRPVSRTTVLAAFRQYVRKAAVDEATTETCLQGLKGRLAASDKDADEGQQLQAEIEDLEERIEAVTSVASGHTYHTGTQRG